MRYKAFSSTFINVKTGPELRMETFTSYLSSKFCNSDFSAILDIHMQHAYIFISFNIDLPNVMHAVHEKRMQFCRLSLGPSFTRMQTLSLCSSKLHFENLFSLHRQSSAQALLSTRSTFNLCARNATA